MHRDQIELAKKIATIAHSGQFRKGTHDPYIFHPFAVADRVRARGGDDVAVAAAYLHDVIEDTPVTSDDLLSMGVSKDIVDAVLELTDVFTHESFPLLKRSIRKHLEAMRLSKVSDRAKLVKICDIEDNDETIELVGGGFAKVWRAEKAVLLQILQSH
jgi:(p)ppGpp synthase/HD superfamily hydrolase